MNARRFGCLMLALVVFGCGQAVDPNRPKTVPVTGTVTYNGEPVEGATVTFIATSGQARGAVATTDASGKFSATTFDPGDGAIPGSYKVMIAKTVLEPAGPDAAPGLDGEEPSDVAKDMLPAKYKDATQSGLTAEVQDGSGAVLTFELTD